MLGEESRIDTLYYENQNDQNITKTARPKKILFWPKKEDFKFKINNFLTLMLINFLVRKLKRTEFFFFFFCPWKPGCQMANFRQKYEF